jgi:acetyltransferase-like isoleucine patch superfamily enzyme
MNGHILKWCFLWAVNRAYCAAHGVQYSTGLRAYGRPLIRRHPGASIVLGADVVLTGDPRVNPAGIMRPVSLAAIRSGAEIVIGDHSGLSGVVIVAAQSVRIGQYVNIGANVSIYDTDFHSLDWRQRRAGDDSQADIQPVVIGDDVWIGANAVILKGVTIGRGAVIGAQSVVTKDVAPGTLWAGNPARFIRAIE